MFQVDVMDGVVHQLKVAGYVHYRGSNLLGDFRVLCKGDHRVLILRTLRVNIDQSVGEYLKDLLEQLMLYMTRHRIRVIYIQSDGKVPMPFYFERYCKKNRVKIRLVSSLLPQSESDIFFNN
jgi:hypothetical protein